MTDTLCKSVKSDREFLENVLSQNEQDQKTMSKPSAILAYIPVLHQGYFQFFEKHPDAKILFLVGKEFTNQYRSLVKDLRAVDPETMKKMIESLGRFEMVEVVDGVDEEVENFHFILPNEEVTIDFAQKYLAHTEVEFDSIFLRWDRSKSLSHTEVEPDVQISQSDFDQQMMKLAFEEATQSSDWWRQTAAVLVKDGKVISSVRNQHVPQDFQQFVDGDPRADFQSGERTDLSTALHAEAAAIALAAQKGLSTDGAWMYATTFPCPYCAPVVAEAGIKKLFYARGYSLIHGAEMLKSKGVEIIKVKMIEM